MQRKIDQNQVLIKKHQREIKENFIFQILLDKFKNPNYNHRMLKKLKTEKSVYLLLKTLYKIHPVISKKFTRIDLSRIFELLKEFKSSVLTHDRFANPGKPAIVFVVLLQIVTCESSLPKSAAAGLLVWWSLGVGVIEMIRNRRGGKGLLGNLDIKEMKKMVTTKVNNELLLEEGI